MTVELVPSFAGGTVEETLVLLPEPAFGILGGVMAMFDLDSVLQADFAEFSFVLLTENRALGIGLFWIEGIHY